MRRIERLHAITNHLRARSPRPVSATSLADRFGVSPRTIERDLRSLADAGVPVYGSPGRAGGYAVLPDHALPPLQLTAREAAACIAALGLMDRSPLAPHARTAADKVRAALPAPLAAAAAELPLLSVLPPGARASAAWLDATADHLLVELAYAGDPASAGSSRTPPSRAGARGTSSAGAAPAQRSGASAPTGSTGSR